MASDQELRDRMTTAADAFSYNINAIRPEAIVVDARRQRRVRSLALAASVTLAALVTAAALARAGNDNEPAATHTASSTVFRLVPSALPDGFVLHRVDPASTPQTSLPPHNLFYRDDRGRRILVISSPQQDAVRSDPPSEATQDRGGFSAGFSAGWSPRDGLYVLVATIGLSKSEAEALLPLIAPGQRGDADRYGFADPPPGFRVAGDERDLAIDGTLSVYIRPAAGLASLPTPHIDVAVGKAKPLLAEVHLYGYDHASIVRIANQDVTVTTFSSLQPAGTVMTTAWIDPSGNIVTVTGFSITEDELVTFARSLHVASDAQWSAHVATAQR